MGLLKTPLQHKRHASNAEIDDDDESPCAFHGGQHPGLSMTTPMALKDISNRAQRELAMLYSPCVEEEEGSPTNELYGKDLNACKKLW